MRSVPSYADRRWGRPDGAIGIDAGAAAVREGIAGTFCNSAATGSMVTSL